MGATQAGIDRANSFFWSELCGTTLARRIGITDASPKSLASFDRAYFEMYQYLRDYLPADPRGVRVLEIGLGYGTVGQFLAANGADYHGLDIASGPVEMMHHRLAQLGLRDSSARIVRGSASEIAHGPEEFDLVVTNGCLHHTGNVNRAVAEIHRVLRPGGRSRRHGLQTGIRSAGLHSPCADVSSRHGVAKRSGPPMTRTSPARPRR